MCWVERGMTSVAIYLYSFCRNKFTQQGSDVQGDDEDEGWSDFPASHRISFHPGSSSWVVNHRRCGSFSGCHTRYQQLHRPWTQLGGPGPRWRLLGDLLQVDAGDVKVTHLKSLISPWKMMRYHYNLLHLDTRSERFITLSFFSFLLGFSFLHQFKVTCHSLSSYLFKICLGPVLSWMCQLHLARTCHGWRASPRWRRTILKIPAIRTMKLRWWILKSCKNELWSGKT